MMIALLTRLTLLLRRFRLNNAEATELQQPAMLSMLHTRVLLVHLSSLLHRSSSPNEGANESQQPSTPSGLDLHTHFARLSSLLSRSRLISGTEPHSTTPLSLRPDALINFLSSFFHSQPRTGEEIEFSQRTMPPHVVDVPAMRDREVLFVAPRPPPHRQNNQPTGNTIPDARPAHSLPVRLLALLVLFLCCAPPRHPNGNAQSTQQQQGQSQGLVQTQAALFQTQSATPLASTSTVPPAPGIRIMPMRAATV